MDSLDSASKPELAPEDSRTISRLGLASNVFVADLRISSLQTNVLTPRVATEEEWVGKPVDSLRKHGQLTSIIVRCDPAGSEIYQVIDGEHRVAAAKRLGWTTIRAELRVIEDSNDAFSLACAANSHHGLKLNETDQALACERMAHHGKTQREIGEIFDKSEKWVSSRLKRGMARKVVF